MLKRLLFVAPVAVAALSLTAATAFADAPPGSQHGSGPATCTVSSNQAALLARLRTDQAALDAAQETLDRDVAAANDPEGHQPWRVEGLAAARTEVANLQALVQKDQETLQQELKQSPSQTRCSNTPAQTSPTTKPSGSGPRVPAATPGLPETGARG